MIPKVINYCWFGNNPLDEKSKECIESWEKIMPDYEIKRWDESNYDVNKNDFMKEAYKNKKWAFVTDYARLDIIYNNGGIYLDTDVKVLKKFDDLLKLNAFMGFEENNKVNTGLGFGANKGNKIVKENLDIYNKIKYKDGLGNFKPTNCPIITTEILKRHGLKNENYKIQNIEGVIVFPREYFAPLDYTSGNLNITEKTYSIHEYGMSWMSKDEQKWHILEQKMQKKIGKKCAHKMIRILSLPKRIINKTRKIGFKNTIKYAIKNSRWRRG